MGRLVLGALLAVSVISFGWRWVAAEPLSLKGGGKVSELLVADSAIVAIYDPAACMSCDNLLADWFRWSGKHPGRFALVLTRTPSAHEQNGMLLRRVRPAGIIARSRARPGWSESGVHYALFINRELAWVKPATASAPPAILQRIAESWLSTAAVSVATSSSATP
jgi:hypothetical protein